MSPVRQTPRRTLRELIKRFIPRLRRKSEPPSKQEPPYPYADVMAPVRRGPRGRSGSAAVAEPDDER